MLSVRRSLSGAAVLAFLGATVSWGVARGATTPLWSQPGPVRHVSRAVEVIVRGTLPNGESVTVFSNGTAQIFSRDRSKVEMRVLPAQSRELLHAGLTAAQREALLGYLMLPTSRAYAAQSVNVVFRNGVTIQQDELTVPPEALLAVRKARSANLAAVMPHITGDYATDAVLAKIGVDRAERIARRFDRGTLTALYERAQSVSSGQLLNVADAFRLHVTGASVENAVATLQKLPAVAYAAPDWTVAEPNVGSAPIPAAAQIEAQRSAYALAADASRDGESQLPSNYGIQSSLQSYENAPGVDSVAAYDEIERKFGQLPGEGEIITDVASGDLDDVSAKSNPQDPCFIYVQIYGPTTTVIGGQRYLDLPSMPLIPTYTADASGNLNGAGELCKVDPTIAAIGLDFSVMAPLPHNLQRSGEVGSGATDLLGIAPGATYRLVDVGTSWQEQIATNSDAIGALLGAAMQSPAPNVVTTSLEFRFDEFGFADRYLEDDPLTQSAIAEIDKTGIAVCIAANNGTNAADGTFAAIGSSGGSAPTEVAGARSQQTLLADVGYSTAPSKVFDSGAIDVGGTTTDDIFALQPQSSQTSGAAYLAREPFAQTRFDGSTSFASGEGARVTIASPSDNIIALLHQTRGSYDAVTVGIDSATSAAPAAATAAVLLQVGKLTGHAFTSVAKLRAFMTLTGTPVQQAPNVDSLDVGPQIDLRRGVESLISTSGTSSAPSLPRVAIAQRRSGTFNLMPNPFTSGLAGSLDATYQEDTNPAAIDLAGPAGASSGPNTDEDALAYITIAPDWENLPKNAQFRLRVIGHAAKVLATTPYTRLLPEAILAAAGLSLASPNSRTVKLEYSARSGPRVLAAKTFSLTFGPADATSQEVLAPIVPPVVTGSTIPVSYDLSNYPNSLLSNPTLVVSYPGRTNPATGPLFFAAYSVPLTKLKGTVKIPVAKLQGGGVYGISILLGPTPSGGGSGYGYGGGGVPPYSDFAFTHVAPTATVRPPAPLLSETGASQTGAHWLEIPYGTPVRVTYDVSNVKGATGAELEISATGPPPGIGPGNTFNNPNGTVIDDNGQDTGSIYHVALSGTSGSITLKTAGPGSANLTPSMAHNIRVIPLAGGEAAGEASDLSTISMDGIVPADGGNLQYGFGVNTNGNVGLLTAIQTLANGGTLSTLQTFSQAENTIVNPLVGASSTSVYQIFGWGVFGDNTGVFAEQLTASPSIPTVSLLHLTTGAVGATLPVPPLCNSGSPGSGYGSGSGSGACSLWSVQGSALFAPDSNDLRPGFYVAGTGLAYTSNLTKGTFGAPVDLRTAIASGNSFISNFAANNTTGKAYAEVLGPLPGPSGGGTSNPCPPGQIIDANLATGKLGSILGPGFNGNTQNAQIAVDSTTDKAVVFSNCSDNLATIDLKTNQITLTPVPSLAKVGFGALYEIIDEKHHLVLLDSLDGPDDQTNNNSLGATLVFDENGKLLKTIEKFFFFDDNFMLQPHFLMVDPSSRTGYNFGAGQSQLEPFSY